MCVESQTTLAIHLHAVEMQVKCYLQHILHSITNMYTNLLHILQLM